MMGKGRQPPKLLSRVLRTVAELHESKGSSVAHIADHIKKELTEHGRLRRNVALEIRRALKYAVDIGALIVKAGKYRCVDKRKVIPVDSLEIVMDCRHKKTNKNICTTRKKRCQSRFGRKQTNRSVRDMHRRKKATKRRRRTKKQSSSHEGGGQKQKQAQQQQQQEPQQPVKQHPLRQTPSPKQSNSGTDKDDKESSFVPSTAPGPNEKSEDLDKKRNIRGSEDGRHQTQYPEYNDTMDGDDRKSLTKVQGKPRRPRRPILPTGRNLADGELESDDPSNGMTFVLTCLLFISLWYGYHK